MARPKKPVDELKDQRVPIMMSEDELKAIDDWRFENRISSRGEAIRRLCQIGLKADENVVSILEKTNASTRRRTAEFERFVSLMKKGPLFLRRGEMIDFATATNRAVLDDQIDMLEAVNRLSDPISAIRRAETIDDALSAARNSKEKMDVLFEKLKRIVDEGQ